MGSRFQFLACPRSELHKMAFVDRCLNSQHVGSIYIGRGYRLHPRVPLDPKLWQKHYNKRTAVERVNSKLKEFAKLDNLKVRGMAKIRLHGLLAVFVVQAKAVTTLDPANGLALRSFVI